MNARSSAVGGLLLAVLTAGSAMGGPSASSEPPIGVSVSVSPEAVGAGSDVLVTVKLDPKPGIKLNKYPKIKLQIPGEPGLVGAVEQSMGSAAPPPPDQMDSNYFHGAIDPLKLAIRLDKQAVKGPHEIRAKLSYFYCVAASGYCAPAKANLSIPVTVR